MSAAEIIASVSAITMVMSALVAAAVSWGLQRGKIATCERDIGALAERQDRSETDLHSKVDRADLSRLEAEVHSKADKADIGELKAAIAAVNGRLDQMLTLLAKRQ